MVKFWLTVRKMFDAMRSDVKRILINTQIGSVILKSVSHLLALYLNKLLLIW